MIKIWILLLCSAIVPLSSIYAQETPATTTTTTTTTNYTVLPPNPLPLFEFEGGYWMPKLNGHVFVTDGNRSTDVNFKSDLGLRDDHGIPEGQVILNTGPESNIHATYLYLDSDGSNNLSRTIVYDGRTYPATTHVTSSLKVQYFSLGWLWNFIHEQGFKLGLIVDAKGISARSSLNAPAYGFSNSQHFTGAAPTPGLSTEYKIIRHLSIFAEITGLPAGRYGYFLDTEGGLKWNIIRNLDLSIGYRAIDVKIDYKNDSGNLSLQGPFAALTLKF